MLEQRVARREELAAKLHATEIAVADDGPGLHGSDVFLAEKPGVRKAAAWALSRSRLLTGCSPELVDRVRALGFPAERSRVLSPP